MWFALPANTPLYRVTRDADTWADVLQGYGAFYTSGGRYHRPRQQTVYATEDPMVALTEWGWHVTLGLSVALGDRKPLAYPLTQTGKLWRFSLNSSLPLIDVTDPAAANQFGYPLHAPFNPHSDRYHACQHLADQISSWTPPVNARPEGLLAPSVRTPVVGLYHPRQVVLFVLPSPVVSHTLAQRATLLDQWDIEIELATAGASQSVGTADPHIAWSAPWVRLSGTNPVPRFSTRPRSTALPLGTWSALDVRYTQH